MNSFSGYTNLPATVIAAPVPDAYLLNNQDRLRRWNVARGTLQRGRKSDLAISDLGYFSENLAPFVSLGKLRCTGSTAFLRNTWK